MAYTRFYELPWYHSDSCLPIPFWTAMEGSRGFLLITPYANLEL